MQQNNFDFKNKFSPYKNVWGCTSARMGSNLIKYVIIISNVGQSPF